MIPSTIFRLSSTSTSFFDLFLYQCILKNDATSASFNSSILTSNYGQHVISLFYQQSMCYQSQATYQPLSFSWRIDVLVIPFLFLTPLRDSPYSLYIVVTDGDLFYCFCIIYLLSSPSSMGKEGVYVTRTCVHTS